MSSLFDFHPSTSERASVLLWLRRFLIIVTILGAIALIGIVFWLLALITEPIVFLLFSLVLAYVLYPLVKLLQRAMPRFLAILIVYLGVLLLLVELGYYVISTAVGQLISLIQTIQTAAPTFGHSLQPAQKEFARAPTTASKTNHLQSFPLLRVTTRRRAHSYDMSLSNTPLKKEACLKNKGEVVPCS